MSDQLFDYGGDSSESLADAFKRLLIAAGAAARSADIFVELRGLEGESPKSLRNVGGGELSAERVRQLVGELEKGALRVLHSEGVEGLESVKSRIREALLRIERHAPGSDEDIRVALAAEFTPLDTMPASVLRLADILGVHHDMRLSVWTERAKFVDDDRVKLASADVGSRREKVTGIVPASMPEICENFINYARKFSRGAGVVAAGQLAVRYGNDRGVPVAPHEAAAFLRCFSVHLGRHDGDEWFAFFNSANDFIRKATNLVEVLGGQCSFEHIKQFHERYNRSLYRSEETAIPESVLRAALELAGYLIEGDSVSPMAPLRGQQGRGISETQVKMVKVFRETLARTGGNKSVRRSDLVRAMLEAGIRESTACVYLGNQGLFKCKGGLCRLADSLESTDEDAKVAGGRRRVQSAPAVAA